MLCPAKPPALNTVFSSLCLSFLRGVLGKGLSSAPSSSSEISSCHYHYGPWWPLQGSGLGRACPLHSPGWECSFLGTELNWSAPANPSLLAWQPENNAGQKYLCGWWKVNFSASVFFPGNRGHRQIQQNRSRDGVRRGSHGESENPAPAPRPPLLPRPSGSVVGVGWGLPALSISDAATPVSLSPSHTVCLSLHHALGETESTVPKAPAQLTQPIRCLEFYPHFLRFSETQTAASWLQLVSDTSWREMRARNVSPVSLSPASWAR